MWMDVREALLELIRTSEPNAQMSSLDAYILNTGYAWAPSPHGQTRDLIAVYAANLGNKEGGGPNLEAFSKMVQAVVANSIDSNKLVRPFEMKKFAADCVSYLQAENSMPLARNSEVDYVGELQLIASGNEVRRGASIVNLVESVVGFTEFLVKFYEGSAVKFHEKFNEPIQNSTSFVVDAYEEIKHLNGVGGVALAMNFLKDSQASAFVGGALENLTKNCIGFFVKPDMHVFRFMLAATGRDKYLDLNDEQLARLDEKDSKNIYVNCRPTKEWSQRAYTLIQNQPKKNWAQWMCIEDMHRLVQHIKISGLELDRIFYMTGSGKISPSVNIRTSMEARYQKLLPLVRLVSGADVFTPEKISGMVELKQKTKFKNQTKKHVKKPQTQEINPEQLKQLNSYKEKINPYKRDDFDRKVNEQLKAGVPLELLLDALKNFPPEKYDTQVKFILKANQIYISR